MDPVPGTRSPVTRPSRSALIVSDSAPLRRYMAKTLEAVRFCCTEAVNGFHAMDLLSERLFDIYAVDLDMPASDGMSFFAVTLAGGFRDPSPVVVGISARPEQEARTGPWASAASLAAMIGKPFRPDELVAAADAALLPALQNSRRKS